MGDPSLVLFPRKESADVQAQLDWRQPALAGPMSIVWPEFVEFAWASDSSFALQLFVEAAFFQRAMDQLALPSDTGRLFSRLFVQTSYGFRAFYQFGPGDWFSAQPKDLA